MIIKIKTMKTLKYNPETIKIIQVITVLFVLHINFLAAINPTDIGRTNPYSICVTCSNTAPETQKEEFLNELLLLTPTTPTEATFTEEATYSEINLMPTTPEEASFDDEQEFINEPVPEYLAPVTFPEADFND
jgi:hypothetical protein